MEITLGFDGSRKRHHSTTDATALIACTLEGHIFVPQVDGVDTIWEPPPGPAGKGWEAPTREIDAAVRTVLDTHNVAGFLADPAKWESFVAAWEGDYGRQVQVKASSAHPFTFWAGEKRITEAVERFHAAVVSGEMTHDGNPTLRRHILNARRKDTRYGVSIRKEHPSSSRKIDACVAAVLAWQARLEALARPRPRPRTGRAQFSGSIF